MPNYKNVTIRGNFVLDKRGNSYFSGKNEDGKNTAVRLLNKKKDEDGNYITIKEEDLKVYLNSSMTDSLKTYIEKNTRLTPKQSGDIQNNAHKKLQDILLGKECFMSFSSASGIYNRANKSLSLDSFAETIETPNGNFHSLKLTEFDKEYGRDQLPVQVEMKYKNENGYTRNLKVGDIEKVQPEGIIFIAKPLMAFSTNQDIAYLFDINKNNIEYKYNFLKEKGKNPTFQNPHYANESSNIVPQVKISVSKSVLRHVGSEKNVLSNIFTMTNNKFQIPLSIDGKSVRINGDNLKDFETDRAVMKACFTHTLKECGNSYEKLFELLKVPSDAIEEARGVDKFSKIILEMNKETNPNKYYESLDELKELMSKTGVKNSPINISTYLSMSDSLKKLNNDPAYRTGYKNSVKQLTNNIANTVKQNIITQLRLFTASKTRGGENILNSMLERVTPLYDENKKIVDIKYKADEKGKTILDYLDVKAKGQVPILKGNQQYPPISLKGMLQNNNLFVPFANRGNSYTIDSNKLLNLLGVPTAISHKKREIKIDIANSTSEKLIEGNNNDNSLAKVNSQPKQVETQQKETAQTEEVVTKTSSFDSVNEIEVSEAQAQELEKEAKVIAIGVDEEEVLSWLKDEAPDAGKAEQVETAPSASYN